MSKKIKIIFAIFAIFIVKSSFANLTATVDNTQVAIGEPIRLIISTDNYTRSSPDISSLNKNFNVIGESSSQQIEYINGNLKRISIWRYDIIPKAKFIQGQQKNKLTIPAVKLGSQHSKPIILTIIPATNSLKSNNNLQATIISSINPKTPYVQQQITFNLKIVLAIDLAARIQAASLSTLAIPDTITKEIGQPDTYQQQINGKRYQVITKKYAIFPQKSGNFTIPSLTFIAQATAKNQPSSNSFGFSQSLFKPIKNIRLNTESKEVKVFAIPKNYSGTWLPTPKLSLTAEITKPKKNGYKTGDIITRTIEINGENLLAEQLPELKIPQQNNISIYKDPDTLNNFAEDNIIDGQRIETINYVVNKAGTYTLPEIKINWWNTDENKLETATLRARIIKITGAIITPMAQSTEKNTSNNSLTIFEDSTIALKDTGSNIIQNITNFIDIYILFIIGLIFTVTITLFVLIKKRKENFFTNPNGSIQLQNSVQLRDASVLSKSNLISKPILRDTLKSLQQACQFNEANNVKTALILVSQSLYHMDKAKSFAHFSNECPYELQFQLNQLNTFLYSNNNEDTWYANNLYDLTKTFADNLENQSSPDPDAIPNLYPTGDLSPKL